MAQDDRRRNPHLQDRPVRLYLSIVGWNVDDPSGAQRHREAWSFLEERLERAKAVRSRRASIVIALVSAVCSSAGAFVFPLIWKWLFLRGG